MSGLNSTHILRYVPSFSRLLVLSAALRVALIVYSEWHDTHSAVKYTDVDYRVFSDAARFILSPSEGNHAEGPFASSLNLGSPYTRATYRYTPLLAVFLAPNEWIHPSFGKYVFAACDILAGILMYRVLVEHILPPTKPKETKSAADDVQSASGETDTRADTPTTDSPTAHQRATLLVATHLLNPLVFTISTRGSSESILSLFVLSTLHCALQARWDACAVLLGLATHWKIYPFIYGVACLGVLGGAERTAGWKGYLGALVNVRTIRFGMISAGTFLVLGAGMYAMWGYPFLYESYLYHLHRLDHRHNFSPYFYLMYLTYPAADGSADAMVSGWRSVLRSPLTSFVPQMTLALGTGLLFGRRKADLVFTFFVQTFAFVVFNKVCTSQYFLWYTLFIPLLVPNLAMGRSQALVCAAVWIGTQALWLSHAYKLEFLGESVFLGLWARGLVYVAGNCWVLGQVMEAYTR